MIEDLHCSARRQGFGHQAGQSPTSDFSTLLDASRTPLYDGASFSILRASMETMNLQTSYGWSNTSVDVLLSLMGEMLSHAHHLPTSCKEVRKQMITLHGLEPNNPGMYQQLCAFPRRIIISYRMPKV
jgi:hypothetical protein